MKTLFLIFCFILLNSCVKISDKPLGKDITQLESKDWDGRWRGNESIFYLKVIDGKKGKAVFFKIGCMPFFTEFRQSGTDKYINYSSKNFKEPELNSTTSLNYTYASNGERLVLLKNVNNVLLKEEFTGEKVKVFKGHKTPVIAASFSLDRSKVIAASKKITIIWDSITGKELRNFKNTFNELLYVTLSPDSKHFVEVYSKFILIRRVLTGKKLKTIKADFKKGDFLLYDLEGKTLRQFEHGFYGKAVKVWNVANREEVRASAHDNREKGKTPLYAGDHYYCMLYKRETNKVEIYDDDKGNLSNVSFIKMVETLKEKVEKLKEKKIGFLNPSLLSQYKEDFKEVLETNNKLISKIDMLLTLEFIKAIEEYEKARKKGTSKKELDEYFKVILKIHEELAKVVAKECFYGPYVLTLKRENNESLLYLHSTVMKESLLVKDFKDHKYRLENNADFEIKLDTQVNSNDFEKVKGFLNKYSPNSLSITTSGSFSRKLIVEKEHLKVFGLLFGKEQLYRLIYSEIDKQKQSINSKLIYKTILKKQMNSLNKGNQKDWSLNSILALSPNNKKVMVKEDGRIKVIQIDNGKTLGSIKNNEQIRAAEFSSDGDSVTIGFKNGLIGFWKSNGELIKTQADLDLNNILAISPDQKKVMVKEGGTIRIIQTNNGRELGSITIFDKKVSSVEFSLDGERFSIGFENGSINVWSFNGELLTKLAELKGDKLETVLRIQENLPYMNVNLKSALNILGHSGNILKCRFTPKGDRIISYAEENAVKIWDLKSGKLIKTFDHLVGSAPISIMGSKRSPKIKIAINLNCDRIISLDNKSEAYTQVKLWDLNTEEVLHVFKYDTKIKVSSISFSPNGESVKALGENELIVWEVKSGKLLKDIRVDGNFFNTVENKRLLTQVQSGKFEFPDSNNASLHHFKNSIYQPLILSRSIISNGRLRPFQNEAHPFIFKLNMMHKNVSLADNIIYSLSKKHLCGIEKEGFVNVYRIDGTLCIVTSRPLIDFYLYELSSNEQWLASLKKNSKSIEVTSTVDSKIKYSLKGHKYGIDSFRISPDGKFIVSASKGGEIKFWDIEKGTLLQSVNGQLNKLTMNFTADGKYIFALNNKYIEIWNTKLQPLGLISF